VTSISGSGRGAFKKSVWPVLEAKKAGKIRYIGFTGHKDPSIHLRMLQTASENRFRFEAVQLPLNVMDGHQFRSFQHQVLPVLRTDNIGVLAMKTFGDDFILRSKSNDPWMVGAYLIFPFRVVTRSMESPKRKRISDVKARVLMVDQIESAVFEGTAVRFGHSKGKGIK
jgi:aryl-alcohol dehydrogenase-like predicted oxidoreductase